MQVTVYEETFDCDVAVKGDNFIKLYKDNICIAEFLGISDFSGYSISGGDWSIEEPTLEERTQALEDALLMLL